jgi:hypothetical protein
MGQEISVSYQAVKSKVYKLIDALVEGEKTEAEVQESMRRWWSLIHPSDRPVAQKYLLMVLERSNSALLAVGDGLSAAGELDLMRAANSEKLLKLQQISKHITLSNAV